MNQAGLAAAPVVVRHELGHVAQKRRRMARLCHTDNIAHLHISHPKASLRPRLARRSHPQNARPAHPASGVRRAEPVACEAEPGGAVLERNFLCEADRGVPAVYPYAVRACCVCGCARQQPSCPGCYDVLAPAPVLVAMVPAQHSAQPRRRSTNRLLLSAPAPAPSLCPR